MKTRLTPAQLRCRREALGYTQTELAALLGVRRDTYVKWETGRQPTPYRVTDTIAGEEQRRNRLIANYLRRVAVGQPVVVPSADPVARVAAGFILSGHPDAAVTLDDGKDR